MKVYVKYENVHSSVRSEKEEAWIFVTNKDEDNVKKEDLDILIYNYKGSEEEFEELREITPELRITLEAMGYAFDIDNQECRPPLPCISVISTEESAQIQNHSISNQINLTEELIAESNAQMPVSNFEYLQKAIDLITQGFLQGRGDDYAHLAFEEPTFKQKQLCDALVRGRWVDAENYLLASGPSKSSIDQFPGEIHIDSGVYALYQLLGEPLLAQLTALSRLTSLQSFPPK